MKDVLTMLGQWHLDVGAVRERMYRAPTPRERERWHALWLLARGATNLWIPVTGEEVAARPGETGGSAGTDGKGFAGASFDFPTRSVARYPPN
jgi:hypothetical protein